MQNSNRFPNIIIGTDDVFEINDFTVVTEFEIFVLSLENALQELREETEAGGKVSLPLGPKSVTDRFIDYENYCFSIQCFKQENGTSGKEELEPKESEDEFNYLCKAASNFVNPQKDFHENSVVDLQYGIDSDFLVITPVGLNNFMPESAVNIIQSAVNVASLNIECEMPIFLQFSEGASVGVMQNRNCFTKFEGVVLNRCLNKHRYLDGVMEMFRQKVDAPIGHESEIKVSLQLDFQKKLGIDQLLDSAASPSSEESVKCSHKYPLQLVDPSLVKELWISAVWADMAEHYLTENETYSNVDARNAHRWKVAMKFDEEFSYELSYAFTRLLEHREEEYSSRSVKNQIPSNETGGSLAASALGPLIQKPAINFELVPRLDMFGETDLSHESISACFAHIMVNSIEEEEATEEEIESAQEALFKKLCLTKSAPANSLTSRLTTCLMSRIDKNLVGFCRLWLKFLEILRHHWEYNLDLPGFTQTERPDLSHCLLHQKLQMIQHSICVRRNKHSELESMEKSAKGSSSSANARENEDDEFYDAIETFEDELPSTSSKSNDAATPRGRSHLLEPAECLKNNQNEPIYVPITQEHGPMTEDQLVKHESYLVALENTNLRNKAQSELLLSDMQAFKAANPGCVLEDFLRWHSPRDVVGNELSERMNLPGNLWEENWKLARAVPASRQNRLFNETKEVEQIFQFFANLKLKELIDLLLPIVSTQMAQLLVRNSAQCLGPLKTDLERMVSRVQYATKTMDDLEAFYDVAASLHSVEEHLMKYSSIVAAFAEQASKANLPLDLGPSTSSIVSQLCHAKFDSVNELSLKSPQICVPVPPESPMLDILKSFLGEEEDMEENDWAKPKRKQIILHRVVPHPGPGSRPMPQRMYTSYREGEFLLRGSFTSDVTFM